LSRRGRSLPANASGFDTHRDSITSRFDCSDGPTVPTTLPPNADGVVIGAPLTINGTEYHLRVTSVPTGIFLT
jgi:hypothetical protein